MKNKDQDSFEDLIGDDIEPLKCKGAIYHGKKTEITPGMLERRRAAQDEKITGGNILDSADHIPLLKPQDYLEFSRPGIQHGVYRNLRLGKYEIQSRLDLHGFTVEQSRRALWQFISDCREHGLRCALVTHGKGEGREKPALLKSCVNHWLRQLEGVLAFHTAQKQHGGLGATYVLISKGDVARKKTTDKLEESRRFRR